MGATLIIPGRLPSLNAYISACNRAWFIGASFKKKQINLIGLYIISCKIPEFKNPIKAEFSWYEKDMRRDRDNIRSAEKYVMDALVQTRRLQNDTQKWVRDSLHHIAIDPINPRVEVCLEECP